jgi:biopolymer transport protein TolR
MASLAPADGSKPPLVTLRADRALAYGEVVEVMGELNHAGFNSISLVTNGSVQAP